MKKVIEFLTKSYTRKLLTQSLCSIMIISIILYLEIKYDYNYVAKWTIILFFIAGILGIAAVFLFVEYIRHILIRFNIKSINDKSRKFMGTKSELIDYDIEYVGPRTSSIILLSFTLLASFFAVIYGITIALNAFLGSFLIDDSWVLEFRFF